MRTRFVVPPGRQATAPPEDWGLARDEVRLLVADGREVRHRRFRQLADELTPGDLVVVNTSATVAAALDAARADGRAVTVHVAGPAPHGAHVVELRSRGGSHGVSDALAGEVLRLPSGGRLRLVRPAMPPRRRLWVARFLIDGPVEDELARHGRPITYGHLDRSEPLAAYQPAVARHPGSAEMASAGRPLTERVVTDLVTRGIGVAPVLLHTGVSSLEIDEPPPPERYEVPAATARLVEHTRRHGGRVVAVGTTVTRALETVARADGLVRAGAGWTDLVLGPDRPARVVDGLITGWHEPDASHLLLLEAVAGPELVEVAYAAAVAGDYRWHEFGDSCLLLPTRAATVVPGLRGRSTEG
ncbi:S-adenosylmethionine:tRNA ribosyltransferase-isomerase [Nitriliruptor alkaliphilus]|uniref:S-adenosylmethionine:tRNA ribosyltransferase-isomerase n=1 Tax=Nitriliruptor alkaliphilus TaxID=427918 RepID=UPI0006976D6E|nr:S-adenosylmethionine:tRNA ribosyltransferase-isomerase [Nitriliruptor alkaliphilus]